jgi:hypothetical protein
MAIHSNDILAEIHEAEAGVSAFNRRLGTIVTDAVATMWCAYLFAAIALISLPEALHQSFTAGFHPLPIVTWIAQTFLQLVLLSVILFGQNLQSEKGDARAEATYRNSTAAEERLDEVLKGIAERGDENARMEQQNNEILKRLEARPPS